MAMTADTTNNSPRSPATTSGDSPQSRRRSLPSPWAQVVRGGGGGVGDADPVSPTASAAVSRSPSSSPAPSPPEQNPSSDNASAAAAASAPTQPDTVQLETSDASNGNVGAPKRPAWNKPVNGVVDSGSVMGGAISWPALSESTRPSPKPSSASASASSSVDSSKPVSDRPASVSQGPIISQSPQRHAPHSGSNPNSTGNHAPARQRSMKHRGSGSGGGSGQSGFRPLAPSPPLPPPPPPGIPILDMHYGTLVPPPPRLDPSVRAARPVGGHGSHSHGGNDHSSQRSSSRRGNFGPRPRGDGHYHNNHGGRRDQDRRDVHVPHQFIPPPGGFIPPPPPGTPPFLPAPMRPFGSPMGFDVAAPPPPYVYVQPMQLESFRGMPIMAQPPPLPMYFPHVDSGLPASIVKQIEYYFSDENLVKDSYLRSNMDHEGWVLVTLIAGFPRVQMLTTNTKLIMDSLRASAVIEVQDGKMRRRNEWKKWIHAPGPLAVDSSSSAPETSSENSLESSMKKVLLDESNSDRNSTGEKKNAQPETSVDKSSSESKLANGDVSAEEDSSSQN